MLPLKEILNRLQSVLRKTFGVHSPGEKRDVYSFGDGIPRLNSVKTFLRTASESLGRFQIFRDSQVAQMEQCLYKQCLTYKGY